MHSSDRLDILLDHVQEYLARRPDPVETAYHLADEVTDQLCRATAQSGRRPEDPLLGGCREDRLERHRERHRERPGGLPDSHSSIQAVRSIRAGLPVIERHRRVSLEDAARNFSLTTGCDSASSVKSQTVPVHTP